MQKHWSQIGLMVSIGITAILVLGFVGESMGLLGDSTGSGTKEPIIFLCTNPECGKSYELTKAELEKLMLADGGAGMGMIPAMVQPKFECKFCGEQSAYIAEKCEKCGTIFIPDSPTGMGRGYPDACPECGYSKIEEIQSKR
jgi:hypothetical protein